MRRLVEAGAPLDHAGDSWMAQRVFTRDPDGHLIELSWDRPREDWPPNWRDPESLSGSATLDIESLLREA